MREEAVHRLSFVLQSLPNAGSYVPNINYLRDTIPNNLCIVDADTCPEWTNFADLYETSFIKPMIKLLNTPNAEPSLRHTTLIQLKVMLQDPSMSEYFFKAEGLSALVRLFDESLRNRFDVAATDIVLPIVSILAHLCRQIPPIRQALSDDEQIYVLLLRSLILHHGNPLFKADCAIVLFTLVHASYAVNGDGCKLTLPVVCKRLYIPYKCTFYRHENLLESRSTIDVLLMDGAGSSEAESCALSGDETDNHWRYVRMSFAEVWFGSLEKVTDSNSERQTSRSGYVRDDGVNVNFNRRLIIRPQDVEIIKSTSPQKCIHHWLKVLRSASTHDQVILSCAAIENYSNVDALNHQEWNCDLFLGAMKRFCSILPQDDADAALLSKILRLLINLIERDFRDVLCWLLKEFQQKKCVFLQLLNADVDFALYAANVRLLEVAMTKAMELQTKKSIDHLLYASSGESQHRQSKTDKAQAHPKTIYEKLFNSASNLLDKVFAQKQMDKLRSLVSLMRVITTSASQLKLDDYTISFLAEKLLKLIIQIKLFGQAGSSFNKNCLLTIGNLMLRANEMKVADKYVRLLSTLCGHRDLEIRAYSWTILTKISTTLTGAEQLVRGKLRASSFESRVLTSYHSPEQS